MKGDPGSEGLHGLRGERGVRGEMGVKGATGELHQCNPALPSGYCNIRTPQGVERVYCDMNTSNCGNAAGGWMRAANIDMTDVSNTCPQGLIESINSCKRMCTCSNDHAGCSSVTFSTHNLSHTKVCGRARGYQFKHTDGFGSYTADGTSLNSYYLDGLSITYGSPRNHIWSFAAGLSKDRNYGSSNCPCAPTDQGAAAPPFVGGKLFLRVGKCWAI